MSDGTIVTAGYQAEASREVRAFYESAEIREWDEVLAAA
jgi:hypothetical protein